MKIRLLYFARVREMIGKDGETRVFDEYVTRVADVLAALEIESKLYRRAFADPDQLRFSLDQEFVDLDAQLHEGAELGIFPPVTGG